MGIEIDAVEFVDTYTPALFERDHNAVFTMTEDIV